MRPDVILHPHICIAHPIIIIFNPYITTCICAWMSRPSKKMHILQWLAMRVSNNKIVTASAWDKRKAKLKDKANRPQKNQNSEKILFEHTCIGAKKYTKMYSYLIKAYRRTENETCTCTQHTLITHQAIIQGAHMSIRGGIKT